MDGRSSAGTTEPPDAPARGLLAHAVALGLLVMLVHVELLAGLVLFERDLSLNWYQQVRSFTRCIGEGSLPLWDPFVSFGQPMLANPNTQVLYPTTWLLLLLPPGTQYAIYVILHTWWGAVGVWLAVRDRGGSTRGALAGAAIWTLCGPTSSVVNLMQHMAGAAWLPWIWIATDRAVVRLRPRDAAIWGAAVAGLAFAGSPDLGVFAALVAAARVGAELLAAPAARARTLRTAAAGAAWAALLSAALALPVLDVVRDSARGNLAEGGTRTTYWSLHPAALLQAVVPVRLAELPISPEQRAALFESRAPVLRSIYLGLPALLLAVAGTGAGAARGARLVASLLFASLLFALGEHTPVHAALATLLPPLRMIRYPEKAMTVASLFLALLAGAGHDAWALPRDRGRGRRGALVAVGGLLLLACGIAAAALPTGSPGTIPTPGGPTLGTLLAPARDVLLLHAALAAAAAIALLGPGRGKAGAAAVAAALAALDLFSAHQGANPTAPAAVLERRPAILDAIDQRDASRLYAFDYWSTEGASRRHLGRNQAHLLVRAPEGEELVVAHAIARRDALLPPAAGAFGYYGSYEPDLIGLQNVAQSRLERVFSAADHPGTLLRLLQLGAVRHVVALHERGLELLLPRGEYPSSYPEPVRLFEVPEPLPRSYVVGGVRGSRGDEIAELLSPSFDFRSTVLLPEREDRTAPDSFEGESRIASLQGDRVRIAARASAPGFLVLVDGYGRGWRARVDGRPAPILRANAAFMAVELSAGSHEVELRYLPGSVVAGLLLSLAGFAGLAAFLVHDRAASRVPIRTGS